MYIIVPIGLMSHIIVPIFPICSITQHNEYITISLYSNGDERVSVTQCEVIASENIEVRDAMTIMTILHECKYTSSFPPFFGRLTDIHYCTHDTPRVTHNTVYKHGDISIWKISPLVEIT